MNRYDFFISIEQAIPSFFPEIDERNIGNCVFTDHTKNKLIFSITFHLLNEKGEATFSHSDFDSNLNKFKSMLTRLGIIDMEDLIKHDHKKDYRRYFFMLPAEIALKFTD